MKYLRFIFFSTLLAILMFGSVSGTVSANIKTEPVKTQQVKTDQSPSLTIYTYDSLLADPGYAFDRAFETYAGLANGSVQVVLLSDAGSIVTRAASEKANPQADVLIGIDNVLVNQARQQDLLTPYKPQGADNLVDGLVNGLASDYLLTPYDYGYISLWYLQNNITEKIDPSSFSFPELLSQGLDNQLIVENPQLSSPGLGFLLSTIALYGSGDSSVTGVTNGSWENLWRDLSVNTALSSSWGDAITQLYTPEANRSMMVSYTTSPAYGACLYNDTSSTALLPSVNGQMYGWQQIEGLGLVKNAPHPDLAKKFIDWFISNEVQSQIYENQWVYPALQGIQAPQCYDAAIDPSNVKPLNSLISQETMKNHLNDWLDTWELAWAEGPVSSTTSTPFNLYYAILPFFILIPIISRKRRDI